jgi:multicomponent K+:H+ antiporter subunit G
MDLAFEIIISGLLIAAGVFGIVGSFGLLKLPDTMTRLHAPTKATTLGVGGVLIASMLHFWVLENTLSWHELLITMFLLLTAPITANLIAKAHLHRFRADEKTSPTGSDRD